MISLFAFYKYVKVYLSPPSVQLSNSVSFDIQPLL
jgi:hypothetical protein